MKKYLLLFSAISVAACSQIPREAYYSHGAPESLLDVSSEVVNLSVADEVALNELTEWIQQDQPTRAELYCAESAPQCQSAQDVLDLYGVPTAYVPAADSVVSLVYERVLARDCQNSYIDNVINPYNLNHPTFGCSVAVNMVQMVSDKHQFVRPNLLDIPYSDRSVAVYNNYLNPDNTQVEGLSGESLLEGVSTE